MLGGVAATGEYSLAEAFDTPSLPSLGQELVVWENSGEVNGVIEDVSVCLGDLSIDVCCVLVLHATSKMVEATEEEGSLAMVGDFRDWHSVDCTPVGEGSVGDVPTAFGGLQVATKDD